MVKKKFKINFLNKDKVHC